ncbi:MAG: site-specific DNA-methyltransferase [Planctomycetes bacterium]|nr:site-specific DNA-methyltransferase [Planctomycetota bacterium]
MAKIEITKTELVWPGKYGGDGNRRETPRVNLPFQVIETINESRATREAKKGPKQPTLFDIYAGKEGDTFEEGWRNKLIWGDNLLVMGSLLEKFAGKIDLIYIDPPFATGADFSFTAPIGETGQQVFKEQSVIEEKAYRDTWGSGTASFIEMLQMRLALMRELLSEDASIFVHIGAEVSHLVRSVIEDVFGADNFRNEIVLPGRAIKNLQQQFEQVSRLQIRHDALFWSSKSPATRFRPYWVEKHDAGNPEGHWHHAWSTADRPTMRYPLLGVTPTSGQWVWSQERAEKAVANYERYLKEGGGRTLAEYWRDTGCKLEFIRPDPKDGKPQYWRAPAETRIADTVWAGIPIYSASQGYPTEKNERFLEEVLQLASNPGDLVADFFCGSGTTVAVAEKLGRRWIGCDLSRWAIHVSRKRLLELEGCKPFEVLNLGKYERKYWQGITFAGKKKDDQQVAIFQYIAFILKLYGAEPLAGMQHLHGKKGKAVVHVGAVDAPVTIDEINACIEECLAVKQSELHVLAWEWEMGLANLMVQDAKRRGVKLLLLNIPREVMEQQAVDKGDIRFFEVAHLEVEIKVEKGRKVTVALKDFAFPYADLIPDEVRSKIKKWSDYIDYWAVDWDFQNDTFMQGWVTYRTRKDRALALKSDAHAYDLPAPSSARQAGKPGRYNVMVKVIDIFGNDTSQVFELEVR